MNAPFYREPALERIARDVITAYDPNLYYGAPAMIPIEDIIEAQGITLEYQCLRKTGCILGETIFDDGLAAVYDLEKGEYTFIEVRGGTILIDSSLCGEDASTGRLRFYLRPRTGALAPAQADLLRNRGERRTADRVI